MPSLPKDFLAGGVEMRGLVLPSPAGEFDGEVNPALSPMMAAQREFISTVSHEFRTPLAALESTQFLLRQRLVGNADARILKYLDAQSGCLAVLRELVDHVLTINGIDNGAIGAGRKRHHVAPLLRNLVDRINASAARPRVVLSAPSDCEASLDERLFRAAVDNLISNALKYSPEDQRVEVAYAMKGNELEVTVADNGRGIPEADRERIFLPFFRASNVGPVAGTGLGLTIARRAVEWHGGSLTFESVEGVGTRFRLRLPAAVVASSQCAA